MLKEAGKPKDSHARQADSAKGRKGSSVKSDDVLSKEPDAYTYEILEKLNQEIIKDTFGEDSAVPDPENDTPEFSQKFMDNMRAIVEEHFGTEAARQFAAQTNRQAVQKNNNIHHRSKRVPETE